MRPNTNQLLASVLSLLLVACLTLGSMAAVAQTATTAGQISAPYPTFEHLTVEWAIAGDDDNDGVVGVRFRRLGSSVWLDSMPLRRIPAGSNEGVSWASRHSGTVFGLQPDTAYEIELTLTDPDGGNASQIINASTRRIPQPTAGGPEIVVTPSTLAASLLGASPGDTLILSPGNYPGFQPTRDGTYGTPIVLRGTAGAVIDGEVGLFSRSHIILDQLTVNGRIRFNGSDHITIINSRITASPTQFNGDGIVAFGRTENAYIADNMLIGSSAWAESSFGVSGNNRGEGIALTGPGHVISNNRIAGFRDNISLLEDDGAVDQFSIDILNNDVSEAADDGIEADFCLHNCRIMRNRVTNAFIAFSSQPSLGGPNYFIRNSAYNVAFVAFKLQRQSEGDVLIHNTIVKNGDGLAVPTNTPVIRLFTRNNLIIGGPGGSYNGFNSGSGDVADIRTLTVDNADLDFDAFGSTNGNFSGRLGDLIFSSLSELRATGLETQAVQVDLSTFRADPEFPANPLLQYAPVDLRLELNTAATDVGEVIPGINQDYTGLAPDAGAIESTSAPPIYGPRTTDVLFSDGFE